jgi:hypothetical protein
MPGFLGGSSGSSGTGGEIRFPKEFIDPVTKLRISQPENLIDTDFEYGLQPTKWETVELINNTPSFFSKSGDTTIPGIASIATNTGTREITVVTATDHGLAVGIPINVTGTKSVTANGSYIINSIPNTTTFTYLCKDIQQGNNAIEDLYTSIITGEFFQGSQIRIADAEGIITDGEAISTLTVKTDSTHGFGLNTPFYFLNLNSTISQEFEASNTAAKSFDSSNSATAQTFDGSNTLSTFNIDWSNSATVGGNTSTISAVSTVNDTITVSHGAETFENRPLGTPLYYNLTVPASSGYFFDNPRGVVFLKTTNGLNNPIGTSVFQVSATPDGDVIDIVSSMSGTFQLANQARTFAGNNVNALTEVPITVVNEAPVIFDGANNRTSFAGVAATNKSGTITGYSGGLISITPDSGVADLDFYVGSMVQYTASSQATGLTLNETYWVDDVFLASGTSYRVTLRTGPGTTGSIITSISGGTGTQKLSAIGVSLTRDVIHARNHGFLIGDMVLYSFPAGAGGRFTSDSDVNYYFVETVFDAHNINLTSQLSQVATITGTGTPVLNEHTVSGVNYKSYTMTSVGSGTVTFSRSGFINLLVVGGGGGGHTGGGGAGGLVYIDQFAVTGGTTYSFTVGARGDASIQTYNGSSSAGGNSTFAGGGLTITATGGGPSGHSNEGTTNETIPRLAGGSGGGAGSDARPYGVSNQTVSFGPYTNVGFGHAGGEGYYAGWTGGGGGGGAGSAGGRPLTGQTNNGRGGSAGIGRQYSLRTGSNEYYAGGGAGGNNTDTSVGQVAGGLGGGGASNTVAYGGATGVNGTGPDTNGNGLSATFYGGGGGGGDHQGSGGHGFRGTVIFRHTA